MTFRNPREAAIFNLERIADAETERDPLSADELIVLKQSRDWPKPELVDFSTGNNYDQNDLKNDERWVEEQQRREHETKATKRGKILEYAIFKNAESADWFGPEAYTVQTTEYDDRHNHIDFVVEWETDEKIERLGIDATTAESAEVIEKKRNIISQEIAEGRFGTVKYFESEIDGSVGPIEQIPRLILAVDRDGVKRLAKDLVHKKPLELADNPEQLLLLEQIQTQMVDQIKETLELVLRQLAYKRRLLSPENKKQLGKLAEIAYQAEHDPNTLHKLLTAIDESPELIEQAKGFPTIDRYLNGFERQRAILRIAEGLIAQKNNSLSAGALERAKQDGQRNAVLQMAPRRFNAPPQLAAQG